jgi:hypothetical protein
MKKREIRCKAAVTRGRDQLTKRLRKSESLNLCRDPAL